ncbi:MAG: hypothetical protein GXP62_05075 [Oligoflexia bacterium]|nr:hypothetical protein [Oligoflexia bacterium]
MTVAIRLLIRLPLAFALGLWLSAGCLGEHCDYGPAVPLDARYQVVEADIDVLQGAEVQVVDGDVTLRWTETDVDYEITWQVYSTDGT